MQLSGTGKKAGFWKTIRVCINCMIVCLLLEGTCLAEESGRTEVVVDGQIVGMEAETETENVEALGSEQKIAGQTEAGRMPQEEMVTDEKLSVLLAEIEAALPADNGDWSMYICNLADGCEGCIHEQSMQAASLIKLYIMGAVYERYDELTERYGKETVDANLYSMITVSDNEAANVLTGYLGDGDSEKGMRAVSDYCLEHGYTCSSMGRLLLHSNEMGDNYTSVRDCGRFLKVIYEQDTEQFPYAEEMFALLKDQTRRHKIPAQMPEGVSVANKTGELADVENDAGIIYDTGFDLVIVFMSENLADVGAAQQTIAELSRQIYDYYHAAE